MIASLYRLYPNQLPSTAGTVHTAIVVRCGRISRCMQVLLICRGRAQRDIAQRQDLEKSLRKKKEHSRLR